MQSRSVRKESCSPRKAKQIKPVLVAIVGGSGSGKTWLASRLESALGKQTVCRVGLDDFYRDRSSLSPQRRARINFDRPEAIDWPELESVMNRCFCGRDTTVPRYDFKTHCRAKTPRSFLARPVVLLDGLWLLRRPALRRLFALKVYLECPADLRLKRRINRDRVERGRSATSVREQFETTVEPMHKKYVAAQRRWADVVITADEMQKRLPDLIKRIKGLMGKTPFVER
jgi:uridine kinase